MGWPGVAEVIRSKTIRNSQARRRRLNDEANRPRSLSCSTNQEAASDKRSAYRCDGRVYCSQMTSCEEAEFFLANCPGVKMDGGGDGVPCERQWCGDR